MYSLKGTKKTKMSSVTANFLYSPKDPNQCNKGEKLQRIGKERLKLPLFKVCTIICVCVLVFQSIKEPIVKLSVLKDKSLASTCK